VYLPHFYGETALCSSRAGTVTEGDPVDTTLELWALVTSDLVHLN